jgi:hypothetical protein
MTEPNNLTDDNEPLWAQLQQQLNEIQRFTDALIESGKWEFRPLSIEQKKQVYLDLVLTTDEERRALYAAQAIKEKAPTRLVAEWFNPGESGRFFNVVADMRNALDALEKGEGHPRLQYTRLHILMAYSDAYLVARQKDTFPTIIEIKQQFESLFGREKLPVGDTIRYVLKQHGFPWRREGGRPKGSKDKQKRAPRKSSR